MLESDATFSPLGDPDALRDPVAYYRDYYDYAPDMYLSVDAQTGTLVDCNATTTRITGYSRAELLGEPILELYDPASRAQARQAFQVFVAAGEVHDVELQVLCKDGRILDVSLSATAVRDAAGKVVRSRSVWRDITEQKRREEQLRASEARFATIFHASPVALHLTRMATGEIVDVNAAAANLLGHSREELIGHNWRDLGPLPDGTPLMTIAQVELGKAVPVTINSRSGLSRSCLATADTISVDGEPCMLVTTIDITEREHSFLAAIVESSFDAVIGCDLNGMVVSWNAAAEQMFGYSAGEVIGRHISFHIPPTGLAEFQDALDGLARGHAFFGVETQRLAKDGRLIDVTSNRFPVRGLKGEVLGVCIVTHDIGEQKRMEKALRASEEKYRFLTESMKDVVWTLDLDAATTTYVSPSIRQMLGYTQEEFVSTPFMSYFAPGSLLRAGQEFVRMSALPEAGGQALDRRYYDVELEAIRKDGLSVWVESIGFTARSAQTGHLELHGVSRDITERKRAEAALQASEQRLHLAANAARLGIWQWNFADDSLEWDERMCELYAVPEEERTAQRTYDAWRSRLHPDDREQAETSARAALVAGSEWDCTFRIVLPAGGSRYIHALSVVEAGEQGQPRRMVGVNQDITQQKTYEQLLEDTNAELERQVAARTAELRATVAELQLANAGKDAFLASISHELRTPLMGVLSMAEMLAAEVRGPLNADQTRYVAAIDESGHRLLETLNNVLLYTQLIAAGSVTREPCILADLSAAAVRTVETKARRKNQLITQTVEPPGLEIDSDAQGIYNMLRMLLDNAIKFTPEGGRIEVAITAQAVETGGAGGGAASAVRIVVTDSGIGMTPAEIAGLFRPFGQLDKTLSRRYEGLGLGLAYVHNMAQLLGGSVAVASRPEGGSRFTVTLPY